MANNKINILFTIPNFKTAGSQFVLQAIYERIDRNFFQPYVLVEKFPEVFPHVIAKEECLFITTQVGHKSYIFKLASLLKIYKINVLHSWDYKSNSIEALACKKAGVSYLYTKKNNAWSKRWFVKSALSTHIAYDNPEMKKRFFSHWLLKNKVSFIPHGVAISRFKPLPKNTEPHKFTIGCIGVLGANKNQLFLLKALAQLPTNFQVFFFGKADVDYATQMQAYIVAHQLEDRVFFKGAIDNKEIPQAMATIDAVVLPSINEGLPLTIIEAMACGVPVLSSNSGGGARFLLEGVLEDCIFEIDNTAILVNQLTALADNKNGVYEKLLQYGVDRVAHNFTVDKEVAAYKALYLKLA